MLTKGVYLIHFKHRKNRLKNQPVFIEYALLILEKEKITSIQ